MPDKSFPCSGAAEGEGAFLVGDIICDLQLPRCPVRTPAHPAPRGPHPFVLPTARPAPARTKLAPGPLGPLRGLHAVPGWRTLGPGSRPPGPPAPYLPRPGRHGEAARVAARPPVPGVREAGCGPA